MKNDGGPAFPRTVHTTTTLTYQTAPFGEEVEQQIPVSYTEPGLSLRDWFAGQALIGILGARNGFLVDVGIDNAPEWAYRCADAMLAAREAAQ